MREISKNIAFTNYLFFFTIIVLVSIQGVYYTPLISSGDLEDYFKAVDFSFAANFICQGFMFVILLQYSLKFKGIKAFVLQLIYSILLVFVLFNLIHTTMGIQFLYYTASFLGLYLAFMARCYYLIKSYKPINSAKVNKNGVYAIIYPPKSISSLISSLFGLGIGSMDVLSVKDGMNTLFNYKRLTSKLHFNIIKNNDFKDAKVIKIHDDSHEFERLFYANYLHMSKYHPIKRNCYTVYKPVFKQMDIWVNTIFPSKFIKKRIK